MAFHRLKLAQAGAPLLRQIHCDNCSLCYSNDFIWHLQLEAYLCVQCRGILYYDPEREAYEIRFEPAEA